MLYWLMVHINRFNCPLSHTPTHTLCESCAFSDNLTQNINAYMCMEQKIHTHTHTHDIRVLSDSPIDK